MSNEIDIYRHLAQDAIEYVFRCEFHNSLGIPLPKVEMLLADDDNYITGQYYITIDKSWQIHLKFGLLPTSYKSFQDEVKVLTRHEIGHYMCCPYDVITHFRMLKCIRNVYYQEFSNLNLDIGRICGSISNHVADIIVDTRNFYLHPNDTLRSEINWIKKGAEISKCPRHSKLMFLTKESIWKKSLEINETNHELLSITDKLACFFLQNGIDNKSTFLKKTEEYTRVFFRLLIEDKKEDSKPDNTNSERQNQSDSSGSSTNNQSQSVASDEGQVGSNGSSNEYSNQEQESTANNGKPKDGDSSGSAFVFADTDKIKEALEILASETSLDEFVDLLNMAGVGNLSSREKKRLWFEVQTADVIPIEEFENNGNKESYSYPTQWKLGDAIEDIDLVLTMTNSPIIIPGITTKKWNHTTNDVVGVEKRQRDLLLIVDTSGSMGNVSDSKSNMHEAIKASFGIISYFEEIKGNVALIGFSDKISTNIGWTNDYNLVRDSILLNGSGGTNFPISKIETILDESKNSLVTVLITDGDIGNLPQTITYFRQYLYDDNKLYILILGKRNSFNSYKQLKEIGANIYQATTAKDFCEAIINDFHY